MPHILEVNPNFPEASLEPKSPEVRLQAWNTEILEKAGHHSFEESQSLLSERLASTERRKARYEGRLSNAKTLSELHARENERKVLDGALAYIPVEENTIIINASDAHGNFADLSIAIRGFLERKARGEKVYFNFSGDISSGDTDNIVPAMEALSALQARFPDEVTIEPGNGDRRGTSLLLGYSREIAMRFAPELHSHLEKLAEEKTAEYASEQKLETAKQAGSLKKMLYGAELAHLARLAGSQAPLAQEFKRDFMKGLYTGATGGRTSKVLSETIGRLGKQIEPLRPWEKAEAQKLPPQILEQAKQIFEYWQLADRALSEQPVLTVYDNPKATVLATHTGFAAGGATLGEIAYSPQVQDRAVWNKLIHPDQGEKPGSVEKYGPYASYDLVAQGRDLEKIMPEAKPTILLVGHNHGNFTENIPTSWGQALRVENCVSSHPKRAGNSAAYVEVKIADMIDHSDNLENAVKFHRVK